MTALTREARLLETFAILADTLVDDYDVVELLQTLVDACRDLLDTTDAGILLADSTGVLELIASTSEAAQLVEVMQVGAEAGPCIESYRTGDRVSLPNIEDAPAIWSEFRRTALDNGFAAVEAIPMRLRDVTIGTLNLLRSTPGSPPDDDVAAARAFADVATIGILHERTLRESEVLSTQLQTALNSRVLIEQAKGVVSFTAGVPVDEAFTLIRTYARGHGLRLSDVAARLVRRELHFGPDTR
ncbi:GAF and ANTAR domain-containing protein [Microbacterium sp. CFH 90308]|uniref:GAF and ANTAR domain-containing protein n=1 Tax=Microbacterium salsuginis TaxID=2722803 RepID=A0ABX1K844_9MICO|nr:GAF and ANTAR domain-containing protein [Microbacterium sp. CFH 90308]NLP82260.1 GAF and ANTAR domain-containing protein [Microbacterium sp. CFH 90308]